MLIPSLADTQGRSKSPHPLRSKNPFHCDAQNSCAHVGISQATTDWQAGRQAKCNFLDQEQHHQLHLIRLREMGDFTFPYFYNYPPYFTLQPVKDTREKQIQLWKELILKYCKHRKCFLVDLEEEFPLFENASIQRKLTFEAREQFLGALIADGRAEWLDKNHRKCLILWRRIQDWAELLLDFVRENGIELMTLEEIISGDETYGTELAGIDRGVLIRAIKILEQRGRAAMFKGSSTDDDGVKFSPN